MDSHYLVYGLRRNYRPSAPMDEGWVWLPYKRSSQCVLCSIHPFRMGHDLQGIYRHGEYPRPQEPHLLCCLHTHPTRRPRDGLYRGGR